MRINRTYVEFEGTVQGSNQSQTVRLGLGADLAPDDDPGKCVRQLQSHVRRLLMDRGNAVIGTGNDESSKTATSESQDRPQAVAGLFQRRRELLEELEKVETQIDRIIQNPPASVGKRRGGLPKSSQPKP